MPQNGEIKRGIDLGLKDYHQRSYLACPDCGKQRWVLIRNGEPQSERCHPCGAKHRVKAKPGSWSNREKHPRWKGGRHVDANGYCSIVVPIDSPYLPMADKRGRVYEHRLAIAQNLGRCLEPGELVHHINGNKQDNRLSNLQLFGRREHSREPFIELEQLRKEVHRLREELRKTRST